MPYRLFLTPKSVVIIPLLLVLIITVACGEDATSTPRPTATSVPTTAPPPATPTTAAMEPTAMPMPTNTPRPGEPTATSAPPTLTPEPTATAIPQATATPRSTLTPVATPAPTPTLGFMTSSVKQLIMVAGPPADETNMPWLMAAGATFQIRPMFEPLIGLERRTGELEPHLAANWELGADARSWTLDLQKDVPWHFGFGDFTAADVVHSFEMDISEDSRTSDRGTWVSRVGSSDNIDVVNPHKMVFNLLVVDPTLWFDFAVKSGNLLIISKAQWDAEGKTGMLDKPAGTGSHQYVDREISQFIQYERVESHWRKTPSFSELMMHFVPEAATRMAMLLTGETHFTELPKELHKTAISAGMQRISGKLPGTAWHYFWGGMYFATPDDLKGIPVENVLVREAMNRAIDRHEIIDTIFDGRGEIATHHAFHPTRQGWDPAWLEEFEENYGYDPAKARQLLADAGYPDGFDIKIYDYARGGYPELPSVNQALCLYFADVGINCTLESVDYATANAPLKDKTLHGYIMGFQPFGAYPPHKITYIMTNTQGGFPAYTHPVLEQLFDELSEAQADDWDVIVGAIGEHLYANYAIMPMFFTLPEAFIDPAVIEEFFAPGGNATPFYTHIEYTVPAS